MRTTSRLVVAVLASFLAGVIVPQAGLVAHDHAHGEAPHVHVGVLDAHEHDAGHAHVHADVGEGHSALALPEHVHNQRPFQLAHRTAPPGLAPTMLAAAARAAAPREPADHAAPSPRSRGPPPHRSA
jgi:hypothetical protein